MFSFNLATVTLALSALSASARVLPRHRAIAARNVTVPSTYDTNYLEDYTTYHARYLALGCEYNHGNDFFDACCHPLLKNETLSSREPRCTPDAGVLSSVSASLEGSTLASPSSTADAATSTPAPAETTPAVAQNVAAPSSSSSDTWTSSSDTWSASSDTWTSSSDTWTSSTDTWTSSSDTWTPTSSSAAASSTSGAQTGGFGTFFYQNGVAGACGTVHGDYDVIVAMDSAIYNQDLCGKQVTITNTDNGKSVTATVADECPTCINANSIDMSLGCFLAIGDLATGQLPISWVWA